MRPTPLLLLALVTACSSDPEATDDAAPSRAASGGQQASAGQAGASAKGGAAGAAQGGSGVQAGAQQGGSSQAGASQGGKAGAPSQAGAGGAGGEGGAPSQGGGAQAGSPQGGGAQAGSPQGGSAQGGAAGEGQAGAAGEAPARLHVVVRVGDGQFDGTDDPQRFCVREGACSTLNEPEIDDFQSGEVYEFDLPPAGGPIERVELGTTTGGNAWRPVCIALLEGDQLRYCNDQLGDVRIGNTGSEVMSFIDSDTTKKLCQSCYGGALTHGPMVGHTTTQSARIWGRLGSARPVTVRYGTSASLDGAMTTTAPGPTFGTDYTFDVELTGLSADTLYHYTIEVDGQDLLAGAHPSFSTAPEGPADFSIGFGSCAKDLPSVAFSSQPIWQSVLDAKPSVFLMIGDAHYANTTDTARIRWFYRQSRDYASVRPFLAHTPTLSVWDDHDFGPNNSDGTIAGKERSLQAFIDYWANPSHGTAQVPGVFTSFSWGHVDVFLLDDRYHRIMSSGQMLGDEQTAWLMAALAASKAQFKLVVTGSTWHDGGSDDSWDGYKSERNALLGAIEKGKIGGVVLLGGDIHRVEAHRVRPKTATTYPIYEFVSSPMANVNSGCSASPASSLLFCHDKDRYFGLLRFTAAGKLTFEVRGEKGDVIDSFSTTAAELTPP